MGFVPDFGWELCARTPEVEDDRGLHFRASLVGGSLAGYDLWSSRAAPEPER